MKYVQSNIITLWSRWRENTHKHGKTSYMQTFKIIMNNCKLSKELSTSFYALLENKCVNPTTMRKCNMHMLKYYMKGFLIRNL